MGALDGLVQSYENDISDGVASNLSIDKDDLCSSLNTKLSDGTDFLGDMVNNQYKSAFDNLNGTLDGLDISTSDLDDINNSMGDLVDALGNVGSISTPAGLDSLAKCFGADFSYELDLTLPGMPSYEFSLGDIFSNWMAGLLGPGLSAVLDALDGLGDILDLESLDSVLAMLNCLTDCDSSAARDLSLDIENSLNSVGLGVDGKVDYSSLNSVADDVKSPLQKTSELKSQAKTAIDDLTNLF